MVSTRSLALASSLAACGLALPTAPNYQQCDPAWGATPMGTKGNGEDSTICGEGCAMSSLSDALAAYGATVPLQTAPLNVTVNMPSTPMTFNAWLEVNNGYHCADGDCNNLVLDAVTRMNSSWTFVGEIDPPQPIAELEAGLDAGNMVYLAHVRNRSHFVLLTGYTAKGSGVFTVSDPYYITYKVDTYDYAGIADVITYNVSLTGPAPASKPVVPYAYPLYKQCDGAWGGDEIGSATGVTICDVGCLMSSVSMALTRFGITVPSGEYAGGRTIGANASYPMTPNPQTFNMWLQNHNGYDDGDDLEESAVPALDPAHIAWSDAYGMHTKNDVPLATVQALLKAGQPVIANVMKGRHFVLVVGWDDAHPDTLLINDPGFDRPSYSYANDVVGWRLFNMTSVTA